MLFVDPLVRLQTNLQYHHFHTHHRADCRGNRAQHSNFDFIPGITIAQISLIIGQTSRQKGCQRDSLATFELLLHSTGPHLQDD